MENIPYYMAYEKRYRKVFEAEIERWGHSPDDEGLYSTLKKWVESNKLQGKKVIEFACGEGAGGVILSELGCIYHGVDISPAAIERAQIAVKPFPNASVSLLDMVSDKVNGIFDAAIDIMGYHMLILDSDRGDYLHNAFDCLSINAPMLFFKESYRWNTPDLDEEITTFEQWMAITGEDYVTPQIKTAPHTGTEIEVNIPLVPARARNKEGYLREMSDAGFIVDEFIEMEFNNQNPYSATIFVHKP